MSRFLDEMTQIISMSNLRSSETGIAGAVVWVSAGEFEGKKGKHGPRIKVSVGKKISMENSVSVTLDSPPKVLGKLSAKIEKQIVKFIDQNRKVLLEYWQMKISTKELLDKIQSVGHAASQDR